jgi:hypothetical protein
LVIFCEKKNSSLYIALDDKKMKSLIRHNVDTYIKSCLAWSPKVEVHTTRHYYYLVLCVWYELMEAAWEAVVLSLHKPATSLK